MSASSQGATVGEGQPNSERQRRSKTTENHVKKQATPSQVRANHEHQQRQQQQQQRQKQFSGTQHGSTRNNAISTKTVNGGPNDARRPKELGSEGRDKTSNRSAATKENPSKRQRDQSGNSNNNVQNDQKKKLESAKSDLAKNLEVCSERAKVIKTQIGAALDRQAKFHEIEQLNDVDELRSSILELANQRISNEAADPGASPQSDVGQQAEANIAENISSSEPKPAIDNPASPQKDSTTQERALATNGARNGDSMALLTVQDARSLPSAIESEPQLGEVSAPGGASEPTGIDGERKHRQGTSAAANPEGSAETKLAVTTDDRPELNLTKRSEVQHTVSNSTPQLTQSPGRADSPSNGCSLASSNCFEPLAARLDPETKFITLRASLERHFEKSPELLDPICKKFIHLTSQIDTLGVCHEQNQVEIRRLTSIKGKLGDLCRELQRSNNQIRIESLAMIKAEQNKAKEQASKIQSTLSGVMKLFDENQQRNLSLKRENIELQNKLRSMLEHCDNWEKCVETTMKQRDIENRLMKTEMAKLSLVHNEEKERFFKEKQELLQALTSMKGQQSRIEEKEAKLRSDLTNYASKYDECQEIIQKGLSKFQLESKRMLKQIEKSRQDYIQLLGKYEASNNKIKQLLEEKQTWAKSLGAVNKKLEALERLCRTLKAENDQLIQAASKTNHQHKDKGDHPEPTENCAQGSESAPSLPEPMV